MISFIVKLGLIVLAGYQYGIGAAVIAFFCWLTVKIDGKDI